MINPIVHKFIKQAVASNEDILLAASKYYDNDDPEDPKRRWDHVLDDIEVAKKIRGRDLTPVELGTLAFHDSGYKNPKGYMWGLKNHPKLSRKILLKEAPGLGFKDDEIKHMAKVISYHMRTPKKNSPLLKDDLQMLMFGADEGTPKKPVDDARKYFMKAIAGRYPEVPDKSDPQFVKKLVERVRTFKDYSNAPGLEYYHRVYPNYHRDLYNYWHSDQIEKDYKQMLEDEKKGKSLKQKSEKKKTVKKARKLYTYVDPDADLSQGILSARLAPEDALMRRYPGRAKNKEELLKLMQERLDDKDRPDLIYALSSPIPDTANPKLLRFRDTHKLVSYNTEDIKDLVKILKRRYRKPPVEVKDVENKKYIQWGRKPKDGGAFFYAPVYKVLTESGKISPELLTEE